MSPKSPVLDEEFLSNEVVYAKDQPEYRQLPALRSEDGVVLTRWTLTDEEREALHSGADLFLFIHTHNQPLQPIRLEVGACRRDLVHFAQRMDLL